MFKISKFWKKSTSLVLLFALSTMVCVPAFAKDVASDSKVLNEVVIDTPQEKIISSEGVTPYAHDFEYKRN